MNDVEELQHRGVFSRGLEPSLRWAVLGTGFIAGAFARTVLANTSQRIVAVGSRTAERSSAFAAEHGIAGAYDSYTAAIDDSDVDAVYVANTADGHKDLALEAIAAGKPVLVEKPFTVNAAEAAEVRDAARAAGVLAMEAMWTRYLPQSDAIRLLLGRGVLGDISIVSADHGQALTSLAPGSRLEKADLGGGALLDLGVYPLAFASELLGAPAQVVAKGHRLASGVDDTANLVCTYAGSTAQALLSTSMSTRTAIVASIAGSAARIDIDSLFFVPSAFTVWGPGFENTVLLTWRDQTGIVAHEGLCYQATALARFVGEGRTDSPVLGLDETVSILSTIDDAAAQIS